METKESNYKQIKTSNQPIYHYKKISYYFNDSEDSNEEQEFS